MNPACSKHFHPICGRKNNYRMEFVENEGLQSFCDKHGKKKRQRAPRAAKGAKESEEEDVYLEDE